MSNYKLYTKIALGYVLLFVIITSVTVPILKKQGVLLILENEIASAKQESKQIANLAGNVLVSKDDKEVVISGIQEGIDKSNTETVFLTVFDWSGKIICHPNDIERGKKDDEQISALNQTMYESMTSEEVYDRIQVATEESTIVYLSPIPNSDLIIAANLNASVIQEKGKLFLKELLLMYFIIGLILFLFLLVAVRFVSGHYEIKLEEKTLQLQDGVLNLSKLNDSLEKYQNRIETIQEAASVNGQKNEVENAETESSKTRLLTYVRNELVSVATTDIAYIYVESTITYVVRRDGKKATTNESLDQIYSYLDPKLFFRANRQFIVSIQAINRIVKFGNSALKIETQPETDQEVVIGKNKAANFKQWLDL
ncbi:LytTR family DNA-binding domain-containing protein [Spongiivirga sp. MCCC 1A20706]|uniref:LytR/AlgR family response regulator transcription factor n=1 Tax=Spongiivirga sp. MCCC 1A20706 TaxID=3160963 RepID=UPI00397784B8